MAQIQPPDPGRFSYADNIRGQLTGILADRFNEEELKSLCFTLEVDYEDLPATGKAYKARELIQYMERRDRINQLLGEVKALRPSLPWQEILPEKTSQISALDKFSLQNNEYFIGREWELQQTTKALREKNGTRIVALYGLGGIGKTALARKAAEICLKEGNFQQAIWVSAKVEKFTGSTVQSLKPTDLSLEGLLTEIAVQCNLPDISKQSLEEKRQNIQSRLASRPTLLILDNLETIPDLEALVIQTVGLLGGESKLLLTSRHKIQQTDTLTIQLGGLEPQDGLAFIREEGYRRGIVAIAEEKDDTLLKIHTVTGGAPLALKLIVGQLCFQPLKIVLENLQTASSNSQDYEFYRFIFKHSWDLLPLTARKILVSMSVFDPASGGTVKLVHQVSKIKEIDFFPAMEILVNMSLVDFAGQLDHRRYVLHPLTHYFILSDIVKKWS